MRVHVNETGFYAFLRCCDVSLAAGMIGPAEHRLRLSYLRELLDPETSRFIDWDWPGDEDSPDESLPQDANGDSEQPFLQPVDADGQIVPWTAFEGVPSEPDLILRLITNTSPTHGAPWLFHQADVDWFPSVPHGHLKPNPAMKLDVYRGLTYDTNRNNRSGKREDRSFIARLWNDTAFRALAANALGYFEHLNPNFNWVKQRGISNPRALPRFRRR